MIVVGYCLFDPQIGPLQALQGNYREPESWKQSHRPRRLVALRARSRAARQRRVPHTGTIPMATAGQGSCTRSTGCTARRARVTCRSLSRRCRLFRQDRTGGPAAGAGSTSARSPTRARGTLRDRHGAGVLGRGSTTARTLRRHRAPERRWCRTDRARDRSRSPASGRAVSVTEKPLDPGVRAPRR